MERGRTKAVVPPPDAKRRILDEAIELIAARGLGSITIRNITDASGVNVAAVNYHFGSKEALLKQVMLEVFGPVREARSEALAHVLDLHAPDPAPVAAILTALIRPLVEAPRGRDGGRTVIRMMQHLRAAPADPIAAFVWTHFDYGAQSFIDALARAMPQLARPETIWRYEFARGAAIHMLWICDPMSTKLKILSGSHAMVDVDDDEVVLGEILQCALAGVGAPPAWSSPAATPEPTRTERAAKGPAAKGPAAKGPAARAVAIV